jgi:hypothetical protein
MSSDGQITKSARPNSSQVAVDLQNQATRHLNGTSHETAALSFKIRAGTLPGLAEDASLRRRVRLQPWRAHSFWSAEYIETDLAFV